MNVTVTGCNGAAVSGRAVTIKAGGVTLASGTTNGSGQVTLTPNATNPTSATIEIAAACGYAASSTAITLACSTLNRTVGLAVDSSHVCVSCCNWPVPKTIPCSANVGDVDLVYTGGIWTGTKIVGGTQVRPCDITYVTCDCDTGPDVTFYPTDPPVSGSTRVLFELRCTGGVWYLKKTEYAANLTLDCVYTALYHANDACWGSGGTPSFEEHSYSPTCGCDVLTGSASFGSSAVINSLCGSACSSPNDPTCPGLTANRTFTYVCHGTITIG